MEVFELKKKPLGHEVRLTEFTGTTSAVGLKSRSATSTGFLFLIQQPIQITKLSLIINRRSDRFDVRLAGHVPMDICAPTLRSINHRTTSDKRQARVHKYCANVTRMDSDGVYVGVSTHNARIEHPGLSRLCGSRQQLSGARSRVWGGIDRKSRHGPPIEQAPRQANQFHPLTLRMQMTCVCVCDVCVRVCGVHVNQYLQT